MPMLAHVHALVAIAALLAAGPPSETGTAAIVAPPPDRPLPAVEPLGDGADPAPGARPAPQEELPLGPAAEAVDRGSPHPEAPASPAVGESGLGELARVALALGAVLVLVFLTRFLIRVGSPLAGGGRPSGVLAVLARYPVARGQHLVLLKSGSRVLLLHQTRSVITPLSEVVEPAEVAELLGRIEGAARDTSPGRFPALLARFGEVKPTGDSVRHADGQGNEIIDLTRRPPRAGSWLGGWLGRRGSP